MLKLYCIITDRQTVLGPIVSFVFGRSPVWLLHTSLLVLLYSCLVISYLLFLFRIPLLFSHTRAWLCLISILVYLYGSQVFSYLRLRSFYVRTPAWLFHISILVDPYNWIFFSYHPLCLSIHIPNCLCCPFVFVRISAKWFHICTIALGFDSFVPSLFVHSVFSFILSAILVCQFIYQTLCLSVNLAFCFLSPFLWIIPLLSVKIILLIVCLRTCLSVSGLFYWLYEKFLAISYLY